MRRCVAAGQAVWQCVAREWRAHDLAVAGAVLPCGLAAGPLGPVLLLAGAAVVTGEVEAFAAVVLVVGQVVAIPVAVAVGAGFRSLRGGQGAWPEGR